MGHWLLQGVTSVGQGGVAENCPVELLDPCWHFEGAMWWLTPSSAPGVPQQL